jgi:hypothetical protein
MSGDINISVEDISLQDYFAFKPSAAKSRSRVCRTAADSLFLGERRKGRKKQFSSAAIFLPAVPSNQSAYAFGATATKAQSKLTSNAFIFK